MIDCSLNLLDGGLAVPRRHNPWSRGIERVDRSALSWNVFAGYCLSNVRSGCVAARLPTLDDAVCPAGIRLERKVGIRFILEQRPMFRRRWLHRRSMPVLCPPRLSRDTV